MKFILYLKVAAAIISSTLCYALGGWDVLLETLVVFCFLDIVTGVTVAIVDRNLSSKIAWFGFARKIGTFVIIALSVRLDIVFGTDLLRSTTVGFFIAEEGVSIIENWAGIGLPLPDKIKQVLAKLKEKKNV